MRARLDMTQKICGCFRSFIARKTNEFSRFAATQMTRLPRATKQYIVIVVDILLCIIFTWLAFCLSRDEFAYLDEYVLLMAALSVTTAIPILSATGVYKSTFRYSSWSDIAPITLATLVYGLLFGTIVSVLSLPQIPGSFSILQPILILLGIGGSRILVKSWLMSMNFNYTPINQRPNALIYGAGSSGHLLADALRLSQSMNVVGFIDDDERLHGTLVNRRPVYSPTKLDDFCTCSLMPIHILIAMPSATRAQRQQVIERLSSYPLIVRSVPSLTDLAKGRATVADIKSLDIDDLLGRETVQPNDQLLKKNITDKTVLVTGAGGSIGSELCRQIIQLNPCKLLLVETNEFALYRISIELEEYRNDILEQESCSIVPLLASVQDRSRVSEIMQIWKPETVYHAAAYKHVPIVEQNLAEGITNNVFGTLILAEAAIEHAVSDFVLISTDKAVRPTNAMGASKRLAEVILQSLHDKQFINSAKIDDICPTPLSNTHVTRLSMVRFGNVLDSSGSVIPRFQQQIRNGGPITLTHKEIIRFFMTIREAAQLVIQSGAMAKGGDVFVLDMGQPVKILDLAKKMIKLSGLEVRDNEKPNGDIEIVVTGLRPGEKLYEELLMDSNPQRTDHNKIFRAQDQFIPWIDLKPEIDALKIELRENNINNVMRLMQKLVPEYKPNSKIVDLTYRDPAASMCDND